MKIYVNEMEKTVPEGTTLSGLAAMFKPGADLLVLNGFPQGADATLREGDRVVLIKRGEAPSSEEFMAQMFARHTPGVQKALSRGVVGVAGLGGLGSNVAVSLARMGVGKLVLADFDVVEPSNLNRQYFFADQLGMPKTRALEQTLKRINPCVELCFHEGRVTPGNIAEIFCGVDVLVEAFDVAGEKAMLVENGLKKLGDAIVIAASGLAGLGPCDELKIHRPGKRLFVVGDLVSEARPGMGLMATRVACAANIQANLAVNLLLEKYALPSSHESPDPA